MAPMSTFTNTTKSSLVDNLIDLAHLSGLSFQKLDSFQHRRRDNVGLRQWVLIQNFVNQRLIAPHDTTYEPLEWTEEDVKQDELNWLDAQLNGLDDLDEEENFEAGYVYISRSNEGMNKVDTMMVTEDSEGDHQQMTTTTYIDGLMDIDEEMPEIHRINLKNNPIMNTDDNACQSPGYHYDHHLFTTSVDHNYHHWKDKSTISSVQPSLSPLTHKPVRLKSTSNSEPVPPPPPISAYRPFFEPSSPPPPQQQQQQQQQQPPPPSRHPSLKVPGSFRKYCLDRDYLVGINPAEIDDSSPFMSYHHHNHQQQHHDNDNVILPSSLIPYSTSANAALLNLVKLYHQSVDEALIDPQKSTDDMALICSSIVSSPKISQGDMAGILEHLGNNGGGGGIVDYGAYHKITGTMENSSNIWFVGGEENVDNDRQKMVLL